MDTKQTSLTSIHSTIGINVKQKIIKYINGEKETVEWLRRLNYPDHVLEKFNISDDYTIEEFENFHYQYDSFGFSISSILDCPRENNTKNEVWCFGCSFTQGAGIPADRSWPSILQKYTSKKIINFGVGGAGPMTALRLIKNWVSIARYKPASILTYGWFPGRFELYDKMNNPIPLISTDYMNNIDMYFNRYPESSENRLLLKHKIEKYILKSDSIYEKCTKDIRDFVTSQDIEYYHLSVELDNKWRWQVPSFGRDFHPYTFDRTTLFSKYNSIENWPAEMLVHPGPNHHKKIAKHFSKYL